MNNVGFKGNKCNNVYILELAKSICGCETNAYKTCVMYTNSSSASRTKCG